MKRCYNDCFVSMLTFLIFICLVNIDNFPLYCLNFSSLFILVFCLLDCSWYSVSGSLAGNDSTSILETACEGKEESVGTATLMFASVE